MALLELAPNHKTGLALRSRAVAASGCWGFADEYAGLVDFAQLGAFITNPLTYAPRQPAAARAALPFPGGVLLHTGLPNPGLRSAVQTYAAKWARMPCPVIVHLALNSGAEVTQCLALLEQLENVAALELGFRADEHAHTISELVRAACAGMLPVLAALPFGVLLVLHALNHNLPVFLAAFAGFAVALAAIWNLPEMRAAALRAGWREFSEYLFLLPLFFSISLLTRSGFFGQFQQLIEIGSRTMGPASMALAQFFGSSVLSALLDNNVVADFAARAIQGLPTALILLFSMSQIAGYALGGCWTHIGSAQSVVAYAFIRRDLDPRFGPLQYVRAVSPLLAMMAVVLTLYICVVAYVTSGG